MNQKPQPLYSASIERSCPVCGQPSYSAAGIHPQCAMEQADAKRMKQVARPKKKAKASNSTGARAWQKICPKCRTFVHCRKAVCECGHTFKMAPKIQSGIHDQSQRMS